MLRTLSEQVDSGQAVIVPVLLGGLQTFGVVRRRKRFLKVKLSSQDGGGQETPGPPGTGTGGKPASGR